MITTSKDYVALAKDKTIGEAEKGDVIVLMTHPSGNPAEVHFDKVSDVLKKGFVIGYDQSGVADTAPKAPGKPIGQMTKQELKAELDANNKAYTGKETNAELRALLIEVL